MAEEYLSPEVQQELFGGPTVFSTLPQADYSNEGRNYPTTQSTQGPGGSPVNATTSWINTIPSWAKNLIQGISSPAGIAGLGGAALGFLDRPKPSGGGTTMAYPGAAQLQRKMVQGPYGPLAEYTGVGGGAPDYTPFVAPTFGAPDVGGRPPTTPAPGPGAGMSMQSKIDLYKQLRGYGLSDERVRRIAETMFGVQTDSDWSELTRRAGVTTGGIAGQTQKPSTDTTSGTKPSAVVGSQTLYTDPSQQKYKPSGMASWLQTSLSPIEKAAAYNAYLSNDMTDAEIRSMADKTFGKQSDSDWAELKRLAGTLPRNLLPSGRSFTDLELKGAVKKFLDSSQKPSTKPEGSTQTIDPNKDYGFTRDPNAVGGMAIVPWYNKKTGQTYRASDTAWRPPSDDWVKGEFDASGNIKPLKSQSQNDSFVTDLQNAMGQSSANQVPSRATVDPKSPTFRQYNLSQEASDFLNRQNAATGNPWEYDSKTRKYTRQGSSGLETMSYDDVQKRALQEKVQSDIALSESRRPQRDPQEQANLDAYVKQALPNLLEDAKRTGGYPQITNFLVKYGITETDINRIFGPGGPSPDFNAKVQSDQINMPIFGYGGGSLAYDRSLGMASGPSAPLTKFSVPDYVTQAYGLLGKTEQKTEGQVPSWLEKYRSLSVGLEDMDRARQTAAEFGRVYGREITPAELDDFMNSGRSNIVQQLGFDPKDTTKYASAIAPAKEATIKKVLQDFETGRSGVVTASDLISLGLGQYKNIRMTPQEALEALNSGNPDQYIQQRARTLGMQSAIPPKSKLFGEVAGLKLTAPEREPTSKYLGGVGISSLPDLIQYFGLNDAELGQLEQLMRSSGDERYATQINQLRTGTLPAPDWGHAAWQNQNTADFFGVTGTPEAENFIYQGAFRPLINEVSGLDKIGYRPGMGLAAGPEKPTAQQAAAAAVGTPYAAAPAAQPAAQPPAPRDLMSLLPSEWGTYTGAEGAQKKIDWFNQQKATEAELRAAGVKPEEIAWMRQNKLGTYAGGGITQGYAHGGEARAYAGGKPLTMEDGGFVFTKKATDKLGRRGIAALGGKMISAPGNGTDDKGITGIIGKNGVTPARVSNGESYFPPGHDTKKLYALMHSLERKA